MLSRIPTHSKLSISIFILIFLFLSGCRKPYPQLSIEQLKFIQGIRTAANTKSKKRLDAVEKAIEELPEDLRTAFTLREFSGLSYEDITEVMNCPVGTVRSRIFRAREAIDKVIKLHL